MLELLENADFAHPPSARFRCRRSRSPSSRGTTLARSSATWRASRVGSIGLTGVAHTMDAYRRLPHGWRTTPEGMPTDRWMWLQSHWAAFRSALCAGERLTYLNVPGPGLSGSCPMPSAPSSSRGWRRRSREPGFADKLGAPAPRCHSSRCGGLPPVGAARATRRRGDPREAGPGGCAIKLVRIRPVRALLAREEPPAFSAR